MENERRIAFDIIKHLATISQDEYETLELNLVSWNGRPGKLDLRRWMREPDGSVKPLRGFTMTADDLARLHDAADAYLNGGQVGTQEQ